MNPKKEQAQQDHQHQQQNQHHEEHPEFLLGTLTTLSNDVLQECIINPFLDDLSVLSLSCCNRYCLQMLLGQSPFATKLWKDLCRSRWKCVLLMEESDGCVVSGTSGGEMPAPYCKEDQGTYCCNNKSMSMDIGSDSDSDSDSDSRKEIVINPWVREYRRRRAMDEKAFDMMKELARAENLVDQKDHQLLYAKFIIHGLDYMDIFQNKQHALVWKDPSIPLAIKNGLIRYELCQRFVTFIGVSPSNDPSGSEPTLETGLIWIAQYLNPCLFSIPSSSSSSPLLQSTTSSSLDYHLNHFESQVNQELDGLAQKLLQRLEQNATYTSYVQRHGHDHTSNTRIVLEEMKYLFDEALSQDRPFCGNTENYYSYHNSLIHSVLATRKGIPITLSIIYSAIVRRAVGMKMRPVNFPGHFLMAVVRVAHDFEGFGNGCISEPGTLFVDAFHGGRILTHGDVAFMATLRNMEWNPDNFESTSYVDVWTRVTMNILNCADVPESLRSLAFVLMTGVFLTDNLHIMDDHQELDERQRKMLGILGSHD